MKAFTLTYSPNVFVNSLTNLKVFLLTQYTPSFMDLDGNEYDTVVIGDQEWIVQNLKVTKYSDGSSIPLITDDNAWIADDTGAMCYYNNQLSNKSTYGGIYNWFAVNKGIVHFERYGLKEEGWRTATAQDYINLSIYLASAVGGKLKETGTTHWQTPNLGATNESGFTGLPGGYRDAGAGAFASLGQNGLFWTNTEDDFYNAYYRNLNYNSNAFSVAVPDKHYGFSVRCVRDVTTPVVSITADNVDITVDSTDITADHL